MKFRRLKIFLLIVVVALIVWWIVMSIIVPKPLFDDGYSTVVYSREEMLLGARIAKDGQWRFPESDSLPSKYVKAVVAYEDKRFFYHPGVDPLSVGRAVTQNIRQKKIVSGASTLTMQTVRLAREIGDRSHFEKMKEMMWAFYVDLRYSKSKILRMYASHAPFGGNVVGLECAAWRYFGRDAFSLSWAESATLAVLPNSPALIHPGRNREVLGEKRDALLKRLYDKGEISEVEYDLALMEPLPDAPKSLPNGAPHLTDLMSSLFPGKRVMTTINYELQQSVQRMADSYMRDNSLNHIYNAGAIVADVESGEVLAYVGNASFRAEPRRGNSVNVIHAPRSTGSILKPLLYAAMLKEGEILPYTLVSDVPLNIGGFMPHNYDRKFHGAVPANKAIERSLNVPLVRMLSKYGTGRFMQLLKDYGMTTLSYSEEHYGASLILGGAEGSLWDMTGMYASMSRVLSHYRGYNGRYYEKDIHPLRVVPDDDKKRDDKPIEGVWDRRLSDDAVLNASSIWFTYEALSSLNRPEEESEWQSFSSSKRIAWKTGTSYGNRDAWSVGTTRRYTVGVWMGNASGEGRPGLTGVSYAAPLLFDIFSLLPASDWFDMPYDELEEVAVCRKSGHRASMWCDEIDTLFIIRSGMNTPVCPYHHLIHTTKDEQWRVDRSCETPDNIFSRSWFVLPPAQAYYYRNYNDYTPLPPFKLGCGGREVREFEIIYPDNNAILLLPRGFSGEKEQFIFSAAHSGENAVLYWHVDEQYIGETTDIHQISCRIDAGKHILSVIDGEGNERNIKFEVRF